MATIEELINQYRSDLPDYLRKMAVAPDRAPAAALEPIVEAARQPAQAMEGKKVVSEETTPVIEPAVQRLRERISQMESEQPGISEAAQQAIEREKAKASRGGLGLGLADTSEYKFSPETLQAIQQQEKDALAAAGEAPKKQTGNALEQALIGFVPAIIGGIAGKLAGVPGGMAAGAAAGGQAGAETLKTISQSESEKYKRETEMYIKKLDMAKEVFKERIKTLTEPELLQMKTKLNSSLVANAENIKMLVQRKEFENLGKVAAQNIPEVQKALALQKQLEEARAELTKTLGKTGTKQTRQETEFGPKDAGAPVFGFAPSANATKEDKKKGKELLSQYGSFRSAADRATASIGKGVFNLPYSDLSRQQKQNLAMLFTEYSKSIYNFGAALSANEERLADIVVPKGVSGEQILANIFNDKSLLNQLKELNQAVFERVSNQLRPYNYQYVGAGAKQAPAAKPEKAVPAEKQAAPTQQKMSADEIRQKLKEIQEKKKALGGSQ